MGNSLLSATEQEELENSKKCRLHVPKTTIVHKLAHPKTGLITCSISSKTKSSESAQIA
jgi:hypothetical protein